MAASKRSYRSPLREAQAGQTREMILETVCASLRAGRLDRMSMREIAAEAGVSERTVYRYFPDRRALLDRLAEWLGERLGTGPLERTVDTVDDLSQLVPEVFRRFDADAELARAAMLVAPDPAEPTEDSRQRSEMMASLVTTSFPELSDAERHGLAALVRSMVNSLTWWRMREEFGLTGEVAGTIIGWALDAVFAEVRRTGQVPTAAGSGNEPSA